MKQKSYYDQLFDLLGQTVSVEVRAHDSLFSTITGTLKKTALTGRFHIKVEGVAFILFNSSSVKKIIKAGDYIVIEISN